MFPDLNMSPIPTPASKLYSTDRVQAFLCKGHDHTSWKAQFSFATTFYSTNEHTVFDIHSAYVYTWLHHRVKVCWIAPNHKKCPAFMLICSMLIPEAVLLIY